MDNINPFHVSKNVRGVFREGDKCGQIDDAVGAIQQSRGNLPCYGDCWSDLVDGFYQQGEFSSAAVEVAERKFHQHPTWTRTIDQTIRQNVGKSATETIARAADLLVRQDELVDSVKDGPCRNIEQLINVHADVSATNPREERRLQNLQTTTDQMYLKQIANDVVFMKDLLKDINLQDADKTIPTHTKQTNGEMKKLLMDTLTKCSLWKHQMHQRTPYHYKQSERFLTTDCKKHALEINQRQMQLANTVKARRMAEEMLRISKEELPRKLLKYVEDVVYPFYSPIQQKSFPAIEEFVVSVYEEVGEAYTKNLIEVENWCENLGELLGIVTNATSSNVTNLPNFSNKEKNKVLERRLKFCRFPLERAYFNYQIFQITRETLPDHHHHVRQVIENIREVAITCNNVIWLFLSTLALIHVEYTLDNIQKTEINLLEALQMVSGLPENLQCNSQKFLRHCHRVLLKHLHKGQLENHHGKFTNG
ncbi:hypothetical protein DMENIID0001_047360 [Sergentomyia squamirostris]